MEFETRFSVKKTLSCVTRYSELVFFLHKLKSRSEIETDMNDRPYIVHGKVSEMSIFLLPHLLQQKNPH